MARGDMHFSQDNYINKRLNSMANFDPYSGINEQVRQRARRLGREEDLKLSKELVDKLTAYEKGALLDIEKTKKQLRQEERENYKKDLRYKIELAKTAEEKAAYERELLQKQQAEKLEKIFTTAVSKIGNAFSTGIEKYLGAFSEYTSKINTRKDNQEKIK